MQMGSEEYEYFLSSQKNNFSKKEEMLINDLNYYEERIRSVGKAETPIDIGLLTIYMKHVKNIRTLLVNLQNNRNEKL